MPVISARFYGIGDIRIDEVAKPIPGPHEALIKVAYAGICGSDLHIYRKGMFVARIPETMGHEFVGIVEAVGEKVRNVGCGDRVVGDPRVGCGKCAWCAEGGYNLCPQLGFIGEAVPGCFAEYLTLPADKLLLLPAEMDLRTAALVEPVAVAMHIVKRSGIRKNEHLGIIGAGPIGLLTMLAAKAIVQASVTMIDISPARLSLAQKLGAEQVLQRFPETGNFVDAAVEAVGLGATLDGSLQWVKPKGRVVLAGIYEDKVDFDPNIIINKELETVGINAYETADLKDAAELLASGKINAEGVISHVMPLAETGEAFRLLTTGEKNAAKILLKP